MYLLCKISTNPLSCLTRCRVQYVVMNLECAQEAHQIVGQCYVTMPSGGKTIYEPQQALPSPYEGVGEYHMWTGEPSPLYCIPWCRSIGKTTTPPCFYWWWQDLSFLGDGKASQKAFLAGGRAHLNCMPNFVHNIYWARNHKCTPCIVTKFCFSPSMLTIEPKMVIISWVCSPISF